MSELSRVKLSDVAKVSTGFAFKGDGYCDEGIRVVRGENVSLGELRWDTIKCWNQLFSQLEKYSLRDGDIVIGMDGSRVGRNRAQIKKSDLPLLLAQRVARVNAKEGYSQNLIAYIIKSPIFEQYVTRVHTGTSIPHISQKQIEEFSFDIITDFKTQTAIAEILSSLDDKIELNNKINQELENLAQTLFKQWFIDFEFPNENGEPYKSSGGEMVDSEMGVIPEGWEVKPIGEFFEMVVGGDWGKDFVDDEYTELNYVIRGTDIPTLTKGTIDSIPYRAIKPSKLKNRQLQINDIVIEISGGSKDQPTGRTILITKEILERLNNNAIPASFCRLIRPKNDFAELLGIYLKKIYDEGKTWEYQNQSTGISNFQFKYFESNELLILPADLRIIDDFNSLISGFYNLRTTNESQELIHLRDTLLPKLISGELEIKEISK